MVTIYSRLRCRFEHVAGLRGLCRPSCSQPVVMGGHGSSCLLPPLATMYGHGSQRYMPYYELPSPPARSLHAKCTSIKRLQQHCYCQHICPDPASDRSTGRRTDSCGLQRLLHFPVQGHTICGGTGALHLLKHIHDRHWHQLRVDPCARVPPIA